MAGKETEGTSGLLAKIKSGETKYESILDTYKFEQRTGSTTKGKTQTREGLTARVQQTEEYRKLVGEYNLELVKYFGAYKGELDSIATYRGLEKILIHFGPTGQVWALKSYANRTADAPIDEVPKQMITIGGKIKTIAENKIQVIEDAYVIVTKDLESATTRFDDAQKLYDQITVQQKDLQAKVAEVGEQLKVATETDRAKWLDKKNTLQAQLDDVEITVGQTANIIKNCNEEIPLLQTNLESYKSIVRDLTVMKTDIQEKIMHYANILPIVQRVKEAALAVKGIEVYGTQIRNTVNQATDIVTGIAKEISAAESRVMGAKIMTPEEKATYRQNLMDAVNIYAEAIQKVDKENKEAYKEVSQ
jgi:hypothetical protein